MGNPYDVHTCSTLYREERLAEARLRHLAQRNGSRSNPISLLVMILALAAILLFASGCTDAASSTTDTSTTDHTASDDLGASAPADSSSSEDPPDPAPAGSSQYASPSADAASYAGMRSSGSWECYTFYPDGTVELRHGGTSAVSDGGIYQGDEDFGEIVWDSGRWTSTVVAEGNGLIVDDLEVSPVERCF